MTTKEKMARANCKARHHPGDSQCRAPDCWCWENELTGASAAFDTLTARPSAEVIAAGAAALKRTGLVNSPAFFITAAESVFEAMIRAMGEGK